MMDEKLLIALEQEGRRIVIKQRGSEVKALFQLWSGTEWQDVSYMPEVAVERPSGKTAAAYNKVNVLKDCVEFTAVITDESTNRWEVTDTVTGHLNGFSVERSWKYTGKVEPNVALLFEVAYPGLDADFWMVPGLLYNGNPIEGSGYHQTGNGIGPQPEILYPTGWDWEGIPWAFSEETSVPSATWLRRGKTALGVFVEPQKELHDLLSAASFERREEADEIRSIVYIPSRDVPFVYRDKNGFTPGRYNWLTVRGEWSYTRKFFVTIYREEPPFSLAGFNRASWEAMTPYRHIPGFSIDEVDRLRSEFMLKYHMIENGEVCGLIQGLYNDGSVRENWMSDGFLALNAEFAYYLYSSALRTGDSERRRLGEKVLRFFLSQQFDNGLFFSNFDLATQEWGYQFGKTLCFTRPMGERLWNFIELVEIMEDGELKEQVLSFCRKSADFFLKNQLPNGSFGKRWNCDGTLEEDSGSNFSYITWFLCRFYKYEQRSEYLEAAERSFEHIKRIVDQEDLKYWVDCLDSGAVDREGATAYLQALNGLYEITGNQTYIVYARKAAEFALTWQYAYDMNFELETPLGGPIFPGKDRQRQFYSSGMTLVSVEHPCMDAWGARLGYELLRLAKFSGDKHYCERGCAAIMASQQVIARKPGDYGLSLVGSQPEQMKSRDWCYGFIGLGKGSCHVLIAWNQVLNLGVLDRVRRNFTEEMELMNTDWGIR